MSATLMGVSLVLQALTLVTLSFFLFHLFRAQGRLLLRLDSLETLERRPAEAPVLKAGLKVGTVLDNFQLPDISGKTVSLSDFRGRKVLLVYWSPSCGFCEMMAEELAPLQKELKSRHIEIVLAASGYELSALAGLQATTLFLKGAPSEKYLTGVVFENCGTPSAYLLDGGGKVEQGLVVGADAIVQMAREAIQKSSLAASRIERTGLKVGTPAPDFTLPGIHGETVTLDQYRGRKVLLVFSDPHCGPCDALAPDLVKLHGKHRNNGMAVVMVGRGDAEENRKKAAQYKMEFPVVLQDRWKLSRQYGIFATPVAFLIGNDGVIMKNVATGPDEIMTLAHEGLASK